MVENKIEGAAANAAAAANTTNPMEIAEQANWSSLFLCPSKSENFLDRNSPRKSVQDNQSSLSCSPCKKVQTLEEVHNVEDPGTYICRKSEPKVRKQFTTLKIPLVPVLLSDNV